MSNDEIELELADDSGGFPLDPIAARGETAVRIAREIISLTGEDGNADVREELMRLLRAVRTSFKTFPAAAETTVHRGSKEPGDGSDL